MASAAQTLNEAFDLIENGDLSAARQLLETIRDDAQDDPDFWWIYAHATEDADQGRAALRRVLELDYEYPDARDLAQRIGVDVPTPAPDAQMATTRPIDAPAPGNLPDLPKADPAAVPDTVNPADEPADTSSDNRNALFIAIIVILLLIISGYLALQALGIIGDDTDPTPTPAPTEIVGVATPVPIIPTTPPEIEATEAVTDEATEAVTDEATEAVTDEATEAVTDEATEAVTDEPADPTDTPTDPTSTATAVDASAQAASDDELATALAEFNVPDAGVTSDETSLGNTLIITVCTTPGPAASSTIGEIADTLTDFELDETYEAIGFAITNCDDDAVFNLLGISRDVYDSFVAGEITLQDLRASLRPI